MRLRTRPRSCQELRDDRGAMAIIIAIMTLVIAALAAFVIDVGALYEERRDLQNGAEAAALAVAIDCANATNCNPADAQPIAEQYASFNANDDAATVNPGDITFDDNEVTVVARTFDAGPNTDGDTSTVDHWFARLFGNAGTAVDAEASARWGTPGTINAIPITFSSCEWDVATSGGTVFGAYRIIYLHDLNPNGNEPVGANGSTPEFCNFGPGQDIDPDNDRAEGGFGYLDTANDCQATITAGGLVLGSPGSGNPNSLGCDPSDILNQTLLIPIFDDVLFDGTGCGGPPGQNCYHIYGFAAFFVQDLDLTGGGWSNQGNICLPQQRCLGGYFERFVSLEEGLEILGEGTAPDLGASVVVLSG